MDKIIYKIRIMKEECSRLDLSVYASSMAFFLFLSLLPLFFLLTAFLSFTPISQEEIKGFLQTLIPVKEVEGIKKIVEPGFSSFWTLGSAILVALWSSGRGMMVLLRGFDRIRKEKKKIGYFCIRLTASIYTGIILLAFLGTLCFGVFGKTVFQFLLEGLVPFSVSILILDKIKSVLVLSMLLFLLCFLYFLTPGQGSSVKEKLPGAFFGTSSWGIFSYAFYLYVEYFHPFEGYGVLRTVLIFLLWLYICCYIILIGAVINENLKYEKREKK